jgi:signal transduction histidine kinase
MTPKLTIPAAAVLLALVAWSAIGGSNPDAPRYDRALAALDTFESTEGALRRNVLSARAGLLNNYDPIATKENALQNALCQLRQSGVDAGAFRPLAALVARQELLIEQFKSDNALLHNSLDYFALLSGRSDVADQGDPMEPAITTLATAVFHLILHRSPAAAHEVDTKLDDLSKGISYTNDKERVQALLAHGRLLNHLLPDTDAAVRAIYDLPRDERQEAVRLSIVTQQGASRAVAMRYRVVLSATTLLLLGWLINLGLRLRHQVAIRHRRAIFEHLIAEISMSLVKSQSDEIEGAVKKALSKLAQWGQADRAYFLVSGVQNLRYIWSGPGISFPAGWPETVLSLRILQDSMAGVVAIPRINLLPDGPDREALSAMGVRAWVCVSSVDPYGTKNILGFDALRKPISSPNDEIRLLRMALDVIANAIERDNMQRERARLEGSLQQARRMETIGALASGVAHNFNNIIGAMLGHAEMAETEVIGNGRIEKHLSAIRTGGERARDIVDQILAFGRRQEPAIRPVSVARLLTETATLLAPTIPANARIAISEVPELALISGDPAQLQQVIINLWKNSIEAMGGAGVVQVRTDLHDMTTSKHLSHGQIRPGCYVCISVTDTGHGLDAAMFERIFEPFFTTRPSGNGLGLATVRAIVSEHGGAMNVTSEVGQGSTFQTWLPQSLFAEVGVPTDAHALIPSGGETVLIVEQDADGLLRNEEILAALGYEPVGFCDAESALDACRSTPERFGAVVIGRLAPCKALALARKLRVAALRLPVLLVATADEVGVDDLVAAGISELITPPLTPGGLASSLGRCLAGGQSPNTRSQKD